MAGHFISGDFAFVSPEKVKALKANLASPRDIIFTQRGTLGQVCVVPENGFDTYLVSQSQMKVTPDFRKYDPEYLFQFFISNAGQKQILESAIQTGVPHTNLSILKSYKLPAPVLPEQRAIAEALSDADALIEALEQLLIKKRRIKQGAMQELLTGKKRLPGFESKIGDKKTEVGVIPEDWEVRSIAQIAPLQRGFDLPTTQLREGPHPVVYSNGVMSFHAIAMARGPGVVTGRSGTLGRVHYVPTDFWPHNTSLWVTKFNDNAPRFVFYLYSSIGFDRFASGSGVPTLNRNDAHAFRMAVPLNKAEQEAIAAVLSDIDEEITALEAKLVKARRVKQGMMQELLTGRIRLI
jgi:type I restriction enzyme S subunit